MELMSSICAALSKMVRTSATVEPSLAYGGGLADGPGAFRNTIDWPPIAKAATATTPMKMTPKRDGPRWCNGEQGGMRACFHSRSVERADALEVAEFIQTKNALPTMLASGTKPQ